MATKYTERGLELLRSSTPTEYKGIWYLNAGEKFASQFTLEGYDISSYTITAVAKSCEVADEVVSNIGSAVTLTTSIIDGSAGVFEVIFPETLSTNTDPNVHEYFLFQVSIDDGADMIEKTPVILLDYQGGIV